MSRRQNHAFSDFITGIFMLTVLSLLAYFTIVISGVDIVRGTERVKATVAFTQVGGLKDHDAVMYRGTKVGSVESIELVEDGLKVHLDIDKAVKIRKSYKIIVCALTMLGGNYLQIDEGEGELIDYVKTELVGQPPIDWMRDVAEISSNIKRFTESQELREAMENVRSITAKCNAIVTRVEAGEGMAGRLLSKDDRLYADFSAAVAAFKRACESMDLGDSVKADAQEVSAGAKRLLASLNEMADRAKTGQGTLGKLMKEEGMYNEVEGLIFDVRQVLDNYRDTTPISTFSSLATGAL